MGSAGGSGAASINVKSDTSVGNACEYECIIEKADKMLVLLKSVYKRFDCRRRAKSVIAESD